MNYSRDETLVLGVLSTQLWLSRKLLKASLGRLCSELRLPLISERTLDRILGRFEKDGRILRIYTDDGGVLYGPTTENPDFARLLRFFLREAPARNKLSLVLRVPEGSMQALGRPDLEGRLIPIEFLEAETETGTEG